MNGRARQARRGGFTLVELLIVIMIIAILAGMMLLATGSATDSARAAKIISDMRDIKGAMVIAAMDQGLGSLNEFGGGGGGGGNLSDITKTDNFWDAVKKALDRPLLTHENGVARAISIGNEGISLKNAQFDGEQRACLVYELSTMAFDGGSVSPRVKAKLAANAKKSGLYQSNANDNAELSYYTDGDSVMMVIM